MEPSAARKVASVLSDGETDPSESLVSEAVAELANMVIGNAVTQLNDAGYEFKVMPPAPLTAEQCQRADEDTEASIVCFETTHGNVHLNIAMHYTKREQPVGA